MPLQTLSTARAHSRNSLFRTAYPAPQSLGLFPKEAIPSLLDRALFEPFFPGFFWLPSRVPVPQIVRAAAVLKAAPPPPRLAIRRPQRLYLDSLPRTTTSTTVQEPYPFCHWVLYLFYFSSLTTSILLASRHPCLRRSLAESMSPPQTVNTPEMARSLLKNTSSRGWVVQKFGGTSVGKFPDKIAEDIVRYVIFFFFQVRRRANSVV